MSKLNLPVSWRETKLHKVAKVQTGLAKGKKNIKDPVILPYLRVANVQDGYLDLSEIKEVEVDKSEIARYSLQKDDVLLTEGGDFDKLGRGHLWQEEIPLCLHQNHIFVVRTNRQVLNPYFFSSLASSDYGKRYFLSCAKQTTNLASINSTQLKDFPVLLPPLSEQYKIAKILLMWDKAIKLTEQLIETKLWRKRGLIQQLLSGERRFRELVQSDAKQKAKYGELPTDWSYIPIAKIAKHVSVKNKADNDYPVLSCTKYDGLVDSLTYFGRQIYSDNTSTYKIVRRGQFAYATNHIEEGSIGYQNLYDHALISPMYTVFQTTEKVDDRFLYRVLKTELYRHIFEVNTSASVDRRGSLRWDAFSQIKIPLPSLPEQQRIADVFDTCDEEIALLEQKRATLDQQKKGLMQQLLTGKVRVKTDQDQLTAIEPQSA